MALVGHRVPFFPGWPKDQAKPGDYCLADPGVLPTDDDCWLVIAPDGSMCSLGAVSPHTVTEHEDGTITVTPSIVTNTWHGFLQAGVWT